MPTVLLWVVWLSLCFAHIVRLVMPYSKRLPLSRGYLIVRGRRCFQESFFPRPIKVAVISGIWHRNQPFRIAWSCYNTIPFIVETASPLLLYPRRWNVEAPCFVLLGRTLRSEACENVPCFRIERSVKSCKEVESRSLPKMCRRR